MKKFTVVIIALGALLSGCIAYDVPNADRGEYRGDREREGASSRVERDRDRDGVPNRQDRRPDDPRRY